MDASNGEMVAKGSEESEGAMNKQQQIDHEHDNDQRGEHRYPDTHQSEAEQVARQRRDELKERLAGVSRKKVVSPATR